MWCWWLIFDVAPTSKSCHQHIWSPTSVTNIDVTRTSDRLRLRNATEHKIIWNDFFYKTIEEIDSFGDDYSGYSELVLEEPEMKKENEEEGSTVTTDVILT